MASIENLPKLFMGVLMCALILGAVVLPVMTALPAATGTYANVINLLMSILPVVLAVVLIIVVMYIAIDRRSD